MGYRINSERAMQFRTWATKVLDTFTKQGYVLDKSRLINGQIFDEDYLSILLLRFRKSEQVREDFTRKSQIYMQQQLIMIRIHR